jgi:hypothetical protein
MSDQKQRRYDPKDDLDPHLGVSQEENTLEHEEPRRDPANQQISDLGRYQGRGFQPSNVW